VIDLHKMNPAHERHSVINRDCSMSNEDIFEAIAKQDSSYTLSGGACPGLTLDDIAFEAYRLQPGEIHFIGTMLGESLWVDHYGKFRVGNMRDVKMSIKKLQAEAAEKRRRDIMNENYVTEAGCQHTGWVARDVQGENRFLCNECGERFARHPQMIKTSPKINKLILPVLDAMTEFRQGMQTFSDACDQARMSAEDFKKAIQNTFPPVDIYEEIATIGSPMTQRIVTGQEPQRTSDPEDIEKNLFPTVGIDLSDLLDVWRDAWPDICSMDYHSYEGSIDRKTLVILTFIDGTKQRLTFDECEIKANGNPLVGGSGPLKKFTHPIVRQNYPQNIVDVFGTKEPF